MFIEDLLQLFVAFVRGHKNRLPNAISNLCRHYINCRILCNFL